jgi:hypothetical protein
MKKLFIVAIAAVLCLSFALPAVAEVKISGMVWFDAYIRSSDEFADAGGVIATPPQTTLFNGQTDLQMNMPTPTNYVKFAYASAKADYGANISFSLGYINHNDNTLDLHANADMWWIPMANMTVKIGMLNQVVGGLAPSINLAMNEYYRNERWAQTNGVGNAGLSTWNRRNDQGANVPSLITFGNLHTSSRAGVEVDYKFTDMVTLKVAAYDPDDDGSTLRAGTVLWSTNGNTTADCEPTIPRFDIAVPITFGNFYIQPKAGWLRNPFDNVMANQEDEFDSWVLGVDAKVTFGPLSLSGEYAFGENLGGTSFTTSSNSFAPSTYVDATGARKFTTVEETMWWVEVSWAATPKITLMANYGEFESQDDQNPANPADDRLFERGGWGIAMRYALKPNVFIVPAFERWTYGDDNKVGAGALRQNSGELDVYGLSFFMMF